MARQPSSFGMKKAGTGCARRGPGPSAVTARPAFQVAWLSSCGALSVSDPADGPLAGSASGGASGPLPV